MMKTERQSANPQLFYNIDLVDRFGDKITITESNEDTFTALVKATTGGMRLWAIHYMETCRVLSRGWLVEDVKAAIKKGAEKCGSQ